MQRKTKENHKSKSMISLIKNSSLDCRQENHSRNYINFISKIDHIFGNASKHKVFVKLAFLLEWDLPNQDDHCGQCLFGAGQMRMPLQQIPKEKVQMWNSCCSESRWKSWYVQTQLKAFLYVNHKFNYGTLFPIEPLGFFIWLSTAATSIKCSRRIHHHWCASTFDTRLRSAPSRSSKILEIDSSQLVCQLKHWTGKRDLISVNNQSWYLRYPNSYWKLENPFFQVLLTQS